MRRALAFGALIVIVVGGCWAANHRPSDAEIESDAAQTESTDVDTAEVDEADEELEDEPEAPSLPEPLPRSEGDHYEAFDLLRNRPLGHRIYDGEQGRSVWIDSRDQGFSRYIQGNHRSDWIVDVNPSPDDEDSLDGVVAARGRIGELTMPAYGEDAQVLELRIFNPVQGDNHLSVTVDGQETQGATLEPGWQKVDVDLDDVDVGEDVELQFEFSNLGRIEGTLSGGALHWARLGPAQGPEMEPPETTTEQGPVELNGAEGLSWVAWLHDDALLELEVEADAGCGPSVEIAVEDGQGGVESIKAASIELVEERGGRQVTTLEIPVETSQVARLHLTGRGADECEEIRLETARLIRPGKVDGVPDDFEPPKYVLIWLIDTLRADYLPIHFDTDVQAPNLQKLADGGVSFENAYVQGTESRASHASLFTGKYPERHGVMRGGTIDPALPILSHFFSDEGYATAKLGANGYVSHLLNLDRGWDYYRNFIHEETAVDAGFITDNALNWMETQGDDPFFLYLGTIDPHATYRRHDDFIGLYEPEDYQGRFQRHLSGHDLEDIKAGTMELTEREKERTINLYKNEITYNDHIFGKLREVFEEEGLWEDTMVVVTADHGEEFWEHGSVGHGHNVHQEMVHVPLIFHYPGGLPEGRVVRSGGEVVDVLPTLLEVLGLDRPDNRQGMSLLPSIFGEHGGYPAPALATQYGLEYGLQIRQWKIYLRSGSMRVYDRDNDPKEMSDVAEDHPLASRWLQDSVGLFRAHRSQWDKEKWGVPNNVSGEFLELVGQD